MNKKLEALNDLRNCLQAYYTMENVPKIDENLEVIESALKAIEIIKNKMPSLIRIRLTRNSEHYNAIMRETRKLTDEEYKLLKEVLEND